MGQTNIKLVNVLGRKIVHKNLEIKNRFMWDIDNKLGSDYLEVPYLREKKLFGGTVPPGKKIIWRYPNINA